MRNELVYLRAESDRVKVRFFNSSYYLKSDQSIRRVDNFVRAFATYPELEDIFFNFPEKLQDEIFNRPDSGGLAWSLRLLINSFDLVKESVLVIPVTAKELRDFPDYLHAVRGSTEPVSNAYETISAKVVAAALSVPTHDPSLRSHFISIRYFTILYILRDVFSEEAVIDMLIKMSPSETKDVAVNFDVVELMENWETFQDEPISWVRELVKSRYTPKD